MAWEPLARSVYVSLKRFHVAPWPEQLWMLSVLQSKMVDEFPSYLSSIFRCFYDEPKCFLQLNFLFRTNSSPKNIYGKPKELLYCMQETPRVTSQPWGASSSLQSELPSDEACSRWLGSEARKPSCVSDRERSA